MIDRRKSFFIVTVDTIVILLMIVNSQITTINNVNAQLVKTRISTLPTTTTTTTPISTSQTDQQQDQIQIEKQIQDNNLTRFTQNVLNTLILKKDHAVNTYKDLNKKLISLQTEYFNLLNKTKVALHNATNYTEDLSLAWCINLLLQNTTNNESSLRACDIGIHDDMVAHNFSSNMTRYAVGFLTARHA